MKLKTLAIYAALLLAITGMISLFMSIANQSPENMPAEFPNDFVAATVNSKDITITEIDREIQEKDTLIEDDLGLARLQVLDTLIQMYVIRDAAIASGIIVSEVEIQNTIDQSIALLGEERYIEELKNSNLTPEQDRQRTRLLLLVQKYNSYVLDEIVSNAKLVEEDVDKFYNENIELFDGSEFAHIFIALSGETENQAEVLEKAEQIIEQLKNGADFSELAADHSEDISTKLNGGYLGKVSDGMTNSIVAEVLKLKAGEFSQVPLVLQSGVHIVKRINEQYIPIDDVREQISQQLLFMEQERLFTEKMEQLREKAEVTINIS